MSDNLVCPYCGARQEITEYPCVVIRAGWKQTEPGVWKCECGGSGRSFQLRSTQMTGKRARHMETGMKKSYMENKQW